MKEEGVNFSGIFNASAWLRSKTAIFSLLAVHASDQVNKSSHHCQPDGAKAETKARVSGESFAPGNVALGRRERKKRNKLPTKIRQNLISAFLVSATSQRAAAHMEKCQIYIRLACSHSSCLDMYRNTFADIDSDSHQPYVALEAVARPTP